MIIKSAFALADYTNDHYVEKGLIYPPISDLHQVSMMITKRVLTLVLKNQPTVDFKIEDIDEMIVQNAWKAEYLPMIKAESVR